MSGDVGKGQPVDRASSVGEARREPVVQLCAFVLGAEGYAIDLMRIREIIQPLKITSVPHAPEFVEGVVNLRGEIIPVVDLRKRLSLPLAPVTRRTKVLICSVGRRRVGLIVDAVSEVLRIPRSAIKPAPDILSLGKGPRFFLGVCGAADRLRLLLNVKALLESRAPVPDPGVRAAARGG